MFYVTTSCVVLKVGIINEIYVGIGSNIGSDLEQSVYTNFLNGKCLFAYISDK